MSVRALALVPAQLTQALLAQRRSLGAPRCATIISIVLRMGIGKFVGNRVIGIMLCDLIRESKVLGT